MDIGSKKLERDRNPFETASILSKLSFFWLRKIFKRGLRETIREEHIFESLKTHQSGRLTKDFSKLWKVEAEKERPKLINVIIRLYGWSVFGWGLGYTLLNTITRLVIQYGIQY